MNPLHSTVFCSSISNESTIPKAHLDSNESTIPKAHLGQSATAGRGDGWCKLNGRDIEKNSSNELLKLIDARNEILIERIEECVNQALLRHLEKVDKPMPVDKPILLPGLPLPGPPDSGALKPDSQVPSLQEAEKAEMVAGDGDELQQTLSAETADEQDDPVMDTNSSFFSSGSQAFGHGYVTLEIVEAQGLHGADFGTSDPYVKVALHEQGEVKENFKTRTLKKTCDPVWNESYRFEIFTPEEAQIELEIWDEDMLSKDDLLGRVKLDPIELKTSGGILERWFAISPEADCPKATGKIFLKASFERCKETASTIAFFRLQRWQSHGDLHTPKGGHGSDLTGLQARLQRVVDSHTFHAVFGAVILFNAIVMLMELEYSGRQAQSSLGWEEPGSNSAPALDTMFIVLEIFFACVFVFELVCRVAAFRLSFLKKISNWFDILIVVGSILEVVGTHSMVNLTFLRLVRLSRIIRFLKAAMMATFCEPLRILINATITSFAYLFWSFVFLAMIEIVSALLMTQVLADYILDDSIELELRRFIYTYYGTTSRSTLTMFQITMAPGQWGLVGRPLVEEVHAGFAWFFVLYIGGVSFAIIRIITALFLRKTLQVANGDEENIKKRKVKKKMKYSESMRDKWESLGDHGKLSMGEFQTVLRSSEGKDWLKKMEITDKDAASIFELVSDSFGLLSLDAFLSGVFRLTDSTKQIDMMVLQHESKKMMGDLHAEIQEVSLLCRQISEKVLNKKSKGESLGETSTSLKALSPARSVSPARSRKASK